MNFGGNYFSDGDELSQSGGFLTEDSEIDSQYGGYTSEESLEGGIDIVDLTQQSGGDEHEHEQQTSAILHHMNQENAEANHVATEKSEEEEPEPEQEQEQKKGGLESVLGSVSGDVNKAQSPTVAQPMPPAQESESAPEPEQKTEPVTEKQIDEEFIKGLLGKAEELPKLNDFVGKSFFDKKDNNVDNVHKKYVLMTGLLTMENAFNIDELNEYVQSITLKEEPDGNYKPDVKCAENIDEDKETRIRERIELLTENLGEIVEKTQELKPSKPSTPGRFKFMR
jgi:hypothetical protein